MIFSILLLLLFQQNTKSEYSGGILFPKESETRQKVSLDGLWNFVLSHPYDPLIGFRENWFEKDLTKLSNQEVILMPVPSSYNDVTENPAIRDHVGLVWYQRTFFVPNAWANLTRVWLRFSAVSYAAQVWVNSKLVMSHEIGHLPFQSEISSVLIYGDINYVTVACDNTLLSDTIPQGRVDYVNTDEGKRLVQSYSFDFFNYAGIHRPVTLFTTPLIYINDIAIATDIVDDTGLVYYFVIVSGNVDSEEHVDIQMKILDAEGAVVAYEFHVQNYTSSNISIPNVKLWWPYLMHESPGYLYTMEIQLNKQSTGEVIDVYRENFGVRTVTWTNTSLLINDKPVYLHGFGKHEDSDIRGKGLDLPLITRDYSLIKWIGANAFRTSHYPYADEIMDLADRYGIMVIDECPSVDTEIFQESLLRKHKRSLTELWNRDKNRPSVIAWSVANEPRTQQVQSDSYFEQVVNHIKGLDGGRRPVTIAIAQNINVDHSAKHLDIISYNRYNGWYTYTGNLDVVVGNIVRDFEEWHTRYNKPVLMAEYGGDAISGMHMLPSAVWSEDYQLQLMSKHFEAFDILRSKGYFIGEFVWNFADFQTEQSYTRAGGNKKGLFTRNRQPKASAYQVRKRYWSLASQINNVTMPKDLNDYIISVPREEL